MTVAFVYEAVWFFSTIPSVASVTYVVLFFFTLKAFLGIFDPPFLTHYFLAIAII